MNKIVFVFIFPIILLFSCTDKNPIVFSKKSNMSEVTLALDTNGTFVYDAKSSVGAAFHEKGTYTIEDSLLILRFEFNSYSRACYEIPLPNDTSLIMNYKGKPMLYPTIKTLENVDLQINTEQLMERVVKNYQHKDFQKYVGTRYFALKSGDLSLIFDGQWKVSPYFDSELPEED